jgi:hypothetical protein
MVHNNSIEGFAYREVCDGLSMHIRRCFAKTAAAKGESIHRRSCERRNPYRVIPRRSAVADALCWPVTAVSC